MIGAKEYLQSIAALDAKINALLAEKDELKDRLQRITPVLSPDKTTGGGGTQDKAAVIIAKMIDLENAINADIDCLVNKKREAVKLLNRLTNPVHVTVLDRRYFRRMSLQDIAKDMQYSLRGMQKLHGRALQAYDRLLKEAGNQ